MSELPLSCCPWRHHNQCPARVSRWNFSPALKPDGALPSHPSLRREGACLNYILTAGVGIWHRIPVNTQPWYLMNSTFRHVVSILMILLVLSLSATCFCSDLAPAAEAAAAGDHCGHCPTDAGHSDGTQPDPGQCDSSCHCACHTSLTGQPLSIVCSLHISPLTFTEPHKSLPEVYLSKFIPPHQA